MLPSVFLEGEDQDEDDYEDMVTHRFVLPCKKSDIRYKPLLTAISFENFHIIPNSKRVILPWYLYDDRGWDVIASNQEDLDLLYEELNNWILDYDREQIDKIFK